MKILNFKLKIKSLLIIFGAMLIFNPSKVLASNFTTDYNVIYDVKDNGTTHADLSITLTNTSAQYYASSYQMQLGFGDVTNIVASDSAGLIKTTSNKNQEGYNVALTFNKKALGLGSRLPFHLSFDTKSIAKQTGKIWEINIPGIANPADFSGFIVKINAPASFGDPAFIKPAQLNKALLFNKAQLGKSGISVGFGKTQTYDFDFSYHIKNTNLYPAKTEIALPSNNNYQDVFIDRIVPKPDSIVVDKDGNWLAQYALSPTEKKDIKVTGKSKISLNPKQTNLTDEQKTLYTRKTKYWQTDDVKIKRLAGELKTPDQIYQYVVKTLHYDFLRVTDDRGRAGAKSALDNPDSAVCREFTDLFIALSRANGIPAREVDGFAYTENNKLRPISLFKDVLHVWPEYYDQEKKTWIMVDPTWGSTTGGVDYFSVMDFDHFAFVIKGIDDSYPSPAGGYKTDTTKDTKDIKVTFADSDVDTAQHFEIANIFNTPQIAGLPLKGKIKVINNGPGSIPTQALYISGKMLEPHDQGYEIDEIPPFGTKTFDVSFKKTNFLTNGQDIIKIRYGGRVREQKVLVAPFFMTLWGIGGIAFGIFTIIILIIAGKSRRLRLHK